MLESITISRETTLPPAQARLPAERRVALNAQKEDDVREEENVKEEAKDQDLSNLEDLVSDAQGNLNSMHDVDLHFSVHKLSGKMMVTVKDASTGDVIREIPPSEILDIAARLEEMVGLLFDQKG